MSLEPSSTRTKHLRKFKRASYAPREDHAVLPPNDFWIFGKHESSMNQVIQFEKPDCYVILPLGNSEQREMPINKLAAPVVSFMAQHGSLAVVFFDFHLRFP